MKRLLIIAAALGLAAAILNEITADGSPHSLALYTAGAMALLALFLRVARRRGRAPRVDVYALGPDHPYYAYYQRKRRKQHGRGGAAL